MSEFKNVWQPVTEKYSAVEAPPAVVPAEPPKELVAAQQARSNKEWEGKKAPIAITVFIWYLFARAGFYALLLFVLAGFPQSSASAWLADAVANFLHLPSVAERDAAREDQLQTQSPPDGDANPSSSDGQNPADDEQSTAREQVMVYLGFAMVTTTVVAVMWLLRSWKIRWITMFYAGAFVAKIGINYFAEMASGVGNQLPPGEIPILMFSFTLNLFIFLYLAFWPGVKDYFEELA